MGVFYLLVEVAQPQHGAGDASEDGEHWRRRRLGPRHQVRDEHGRRRRDDTHGQTAADKRHCPTHGAVRHTGWRIVIPGGGLSHRVADCHTVRRIVIPGGGILHRVAKFHIGWRNFTPGGGLSHRVAEFHIGWRNFTPGCGLSYRVADCHIGWWIVTPGGGISHRVAKFHTWWRTVIPGGGLSHRVVDCYTGWRAVTSGGGLSCCTVTPAGGLFIHCLIKHSNSPLCAIPSDVHACIGMCYQVNAIHAIKCNTIQHTRSLTVKQSGELTHGEHCRRTVTPSGGLSHELVYCHTGWRIAVLSPITYRSLAQNFPQQEASTRRG